MISTKGGWVSSEGPPFLNNGFEAGGLVARYRKMTLLNASSADEDLVMFVGNSSTTSTRDDSSDRRSDATSEGLRFEASNSRLPKLPLLLTKSSNCDAME